ncbi:Fumarylacetoacetate (FAA) hydrolase [Mycobacteroides abscessus subsp. abscessus]|nr:Fumarylacetoacetate (FAA) hydrolase [Mycobacteroides abscessus subsp. abscessus]
MIDETEVRAMRRRHADGAIVVEVRSDDGWHQWTNDQLPLGLPPVPAWRDAAVDGLTTDTRLPFAPLSFRDFMLYEQHVIDASRAMARRYLPGRYRVTAAYERITGSTFPMFKPNRLWFEQPIYYMSNALTFVPSGTPVTTPAYAHDVDYELELGFVIGRPLRDATPAEAAAAISGYVVLNDLSARDVQIAEMRSGFGPQKAKHFASSMSDTLVAATPDIDPAALEAEVKINGVTVTRSSTRGMQYSLGEALAHASKSEQLYPGELFGTGTLPGCSGIESDHLPQAGDKIELTIHGIGTITHEFRSEAERHRA